jgi:hypothetical protein
MVLCPRELASDFSQVMQVLPIGPDCCNRKFTYHEKILPNPGKKTFEISF